MAGLRKDRLAWGLVVALAGLLAWAWHDGGEREPRLIVEPVVLPGASR